MPRARRKTRKQEMRSRNCECGAVQVENMEEKELGERNRRRTMNNPKAITRGRRKTRKHEMRSRNCECESAQVNLHR